jgi:hypothetical protein
VEGEETEARVEGGGDRDGGGRTDGRGEWGTAAAQEGRFRDWVDGDTTGAGETADGGDDMPPAR